MDNLSKSLQALDAAADELLQKSKAVDEDNDNLNPDEVSEKDAKPETIQKCDNPDGDNVKKGEDCADGDCDDNVQKSEDTEDSDDAPADEEPVSKSLEDTQQSVEDDFRADPDIVKGIENSEFNAAMIATLVKSLGEIQYDISQSKKSSDSSTAILAKSLQASLSTNQKLMAENDKLIRRVNKLEKSLDQGFEKILDAIDSMSAEPAHTRKSLESISVHDKDFSKSLGSTSVGGFDSLSKGQVMSILTNELYSGNAAVSANDVIGYESGAPLSPELKALVASKCK